MCVVAVAGVVVGGCVGVGVGGRRRDGGGQESEQLIAGGPAGGEGTAGKHALWPAAGGGRLDGGQRLAARRGTPRKRGSKIGPRTRNAVVVLRLKDESVEHEVDGLADERAVHHELACGSEACLGGGHNIIQGMGIATRQCQQRGG